MSGDRSPASHLLYLFSGARVALQLPLQARGLYPRKRARDVETAQGKSSPRLKVTLSAQLSNNRKIRCHEVTKGELRRQADVHNSLTCACARDPRIHSSTIALNFQIDHSSLFQHPEIFEAGRLNGSLFGIRYLAALQKPLRPEAPILTSHVLRSGLLYVDENIKASYQ
jgi:hypothetical protein